MTSTICTRRVLSVSDARRILGLLEPVHLHQPLSERAEKRARRPAFALVKDKDYFVLTTNVDHCFRKPDFDKNRLFYTQGDYGLFNAASRAARETFDNREDRPHDGRSTGLHRSGRRSDAADRRGKMAVPSELLPRCPHCGRPMVMNLRCDDKFAEDEGWHAAAERYENFLRMRGAGKTPLLELGVGYNTPVFCSLRTGKSETKTLRKTA